MSDYDDAWVDALIFGVKACSTCGTEKPRNSEHFQRDGNNADGLKATCKACMRGDNLRMNAATKIPDMDTLVTQNDSESGAKSQTQGEVVRA